MLTLATPPAPPPERALLSTLEVSRLLGLAPKSVRKLADAQRLPVVRVGRALRYPRQALEAWLRDPRTWEGPRHVAA